MTVTLVLPDHIASELLAVAQLDLESAGVLLARPLLGSSGDLRLLARTIQWVPEHSYLTREVDRLSIASDGYVPALAAAEEDGAVPIWLHTHPGDGSSPRPSRHDRIVDQELADVFRLRAGNEFYGAIVIAHERGQLRFAGHIESVTASADIDRIWSVGRRFKLTQNALHTSDSIPSEFDRNIRAFGGEVQLVLRALRVAVIGSGGTGSAVAEQLVRLGVRNLLLVDPDELSASNVTRVYGSTPNDVGRPKVEVLGDHLHRIAPDILLETSQAMITAESTARRLVDVDFVFGCTDDNAGRLVLSRLASYMLIPVIDCGVLLSTDAGGQLVGIDGRVTLIAPGAACLVCRGRIDLQRAAAEVMMPEEYERLAGEGYAPALAGVEPAVVAYTTAVAATAVSELVERLVRYGPEPAPSEVLLRLHEREISTNDLCPREGHYCDPAAGKLGLGGTEPFLEQTWAR